MQWLTTVKQFILKIKGCEMVVVDIGYRKLVMRKEQAMILADILESAESFEEKYWNEEKRKEKGMTDSYTYHVYHEGSGYSMRLISDHLYEMAKLAGKPT